MKILVSISIILFAITGIVFSADPALLGSPFSLNFFDLAVSSSSQSDQEITKEFKVTPGKLLNIDLNTGGKITVKGWDKDLVNVHASLYGKNWKDIEINIEENSGDVTIDSDIMYAKRHGHTNANVDLEVYVPQKFDVRFKTMGGDITLNNIKGELKGQTMGGRLNLSSLTGELDLKTMGGQIDLKDSDVDGKVETMGGSVSIHDVSGNVEGSSMGGNVEYKNVKRRNEASGSKEIRITTMGGSIDLDDAPSGADVHTMGGNININSVSNFVKAKTMGGDIIINQVDGNVEATTMGGDVDIKVLGDSKTSGRDIHLVSMSGDVILRVPKDFSMDIDAEVDNDSYDITSDFNISKETLSRDEDDDEHYIKGTGKILGGNNFVKLEAKNGNIRIESY